MGPGSKLLSGGPVWAMTQVREKHKVEWSQKEVHIATKASQKIVTVPDDYMDLKIQGLNKIKVYELFWIQSLG